MYGALLCLCKLSDTPSATISLEITSAILTTPLDLLKRIRNVKYVYIYIHESKEVHFILTAAEGPVRYSLITIGVLNINTIPFNNMI